MENVYDVAVVGAGPAGSVAAEDIAKAGRRVVLLEKSDVPGKDSVCGGMIGQKDAEHFRIDPSIIEKRLHKSVACLPWGSVEIRLPETLWNAVLTVQRKNLDRFLAERAARVGAELRTRCRVTEVRRVSTGEMVLDVSEKGEKREIRSRLVVFADGPVTLAHRCLGIGFDANPNRTALAVICDFETPRNEMDFYEAYYVRDIVPHIFGWNFPFSEHLNFGLGMPVALTKKHRTLFNRVLDHMLEEHPSSSRLISGNRMIRKRGAFLPMRSARRIHGDSCLVVGDAAGFVSPITGVGITFAMHSGAAAAETAVEALEKGDLSAEFLSRYAKRWRASRKYRKLWVMETLYWVLAPLHRLDPQLMNKLLFFLNLLFTKPEGRSLRFVDFVRVLLFPLLGNPNIEVVRTGKPAKASSGIGLDKGV